MADLDIHDVCKIQLQKSVAALCTYEEAAKNGKKNLLEDAETVYMIFSLEKMLPLEHKRWKLLKVKLPHIPLEDNPSICLFVKDLEKGRDIDDDKTIWKFKQLLAEHKITGVSEIIPLHMLRTHYKPYETKRHLANSYSLFLCDACIQGYIPRLLGKEFLRKKQLPLKINFKAKKLDHEFSKAIHTSCVHFNGDGNSYHLKLGHSGFPEEKLVDNFLAACEELKKHMPGGWLNVKSLHVKTDKSPAFPVYVSQESGNDVKIEMPVKKVNVFTDELSTMLNGNVSVYLDGTVSVKRSFCEDDETEKKKMTDKDNAHDKDSGTESSSECEDELEEFERKHISKRQKTMKTVETKVTI